MTAPSPLCEVKVGGAAYVGTAGGVDLTPGATIVIRLISQTGVGPWVPSCIYTDETSDAATITAALTIDSVLKTATFVAPAAGKALLFQSQVNEGKGPDGAPSEGATTTLGLYTRTAAGLRVCAANETTEGNATFGTAAPLNAKIREAPGGGGSTPTGSGFVRVTSGAQEAAAEAVDLAGGSTYVTGVLPAANREAPTAAEVLDALASAASDVAVGTNKITELLPGEATGDAVEYDQMLAAIAAGSTYSFLPANGPTAAGFTTVINNGFDGETIVNAPEAGVVLYRAGAQALELTGGLKAIPAGSAWTLTQIFTLQTNGFAALSGSKIAMGGLALSDGTKLTNFGPLRYNGGGNFIGFSRKNWIDEDTYTATGGVETPNGGGATDFTDDIVALFAKGVPLAIQLRLRSGTIEFWWSRTGREATWFHESSLDVAVGAFLGTITHYGSGIWGYDACPIYMNVGYLHGAP